MKEHKPKLKKWTAPTVVIISSPTVKTDNSRNETTLPVDGTFNGNNTHSFPGIGHRYLKSFTS